MSHIEPVHGFPGRLGTSKARIGRAHYHVSELRRLLGEWRDSHPYTISRLPGNEPGTVIDRADAAMPPPMDASVIVSDAIHQARSALDNLVNALRPSGPAPAVRFPVAATPAEYDRQAASALGGVPDWPQVAIRGMQPFAPGGEYVGAELARLHDLARIDRHRVLPLQVAFVTPGIVEGQVVTFRGDGKGWAETEFRPELVHRVHFELEVRFADDAPGVAGFEVVSEVTHLVTIAGSVVELLLDLWLRRPRDIQ